MCKSLIKDFLKVATLSDHSKVSNSLYFKYRGLIIRISDHFAKNSSGSIQIIYTQNNCPYYAVFIDDIGKCIILRKKEIFKSLDCWCDLLNLSRNSYSKNEIYEDLVSSKLIEDDHQTITTKYQTLFDELKDLTNQKGTVPIGISTTKTPILLEQYNVDTEDFKKFYALTLKAYRNALSWDILKVKIIAKYGK